MNIKLKGIWIWNERVFEYSVMQSDGNSFWGDVVLDNVNMLYTFKESILDQIYKNQVFADLYFEDVLF